MTQYSAPTPFWIYTGQVKRYIWYDQPLSQGCYHGQLQDLTDGAPA